jgi:hypothetical protein
MTAEIMGETEASGPAKTPKTCGRSISRLKVEFIMGHDPRHHSLPPDWHERSSLVARKHTSR